MIRLINPRDIATAKTQQVKNQKIEHANRFKLPSDYTKPVQLRPKTRKCSQNTSLSIKAARNTTSYTCSPEEVQNSEEKLVTLNSTTFQEHTGKRINIEMSSERESPDIRRKNQSMIEHFTLDQSLEGSFQAKPRKNSGEIIKLRPQNRTSSPINKLLTL